MVLIEKIFNPLSSYHHRRISRYLNELNIEKIVDIGAHKGEFLENVIKIEKINSFYAFEPQKNIFNDLKEQSDALKYGIANFAKEIINIGDNIERAKSSISDDVRSNDSIKSVVDGLDLIAQSTLSTFEKIGIKKIKSLNEKFDHNFHQAMMEIEKNDCEPGTIVQELIPGYTLHDRLLRPAMVGVSKKPQENQGAKDTEEEEQSEK